MASPDVDLTAIVLAELVRQAARISGAQIEAFRGIQPLLVFIPRVGSMVAIDFAACPVEPGEGRAAGRRRRAWARVHGGEAVLAGHAVLGCGAAWTAPPIRIKPVYTAPLNTRYGLTRQCNKHGVAEDSGREALDATDRHRAAFSPAAACRGCTVAF